MDIRYKIEFYSNWHCGSGLAAGADVDALVVKSADGLPYVPGRTLKGLLREAASQLSDDTTLLNKLFGLSGDEALPSPEMTRAGEVFYGNATLQDGPTIVAKKLTPHLYQTFASTRIDEESGIAKDNTLRKIETVVPCTLTGYISGVPADGRPLLEEAMQMVKRLGTGRHRGYGRCKISIISE